MESQDIETINASTIATIHNNVNTSIYVRTNDTMLTITEKTEKIVIYLKLLKSICSQVFELYIGDHYSKKYRIRLPLRNLELIIKELRPLLTTLDSIQNLHVS